MREISKEFHAFFLKKREQKNGYKSISYNFYYLMDWTDNSRRNCRKKKNRSPHWFWLAIWPGIGLWVFVE